MFETPGSGFRLEGLCTGYPATPLSPSFNFFSMTLFKREIISQSVLTWLKI